VTVALQLCQNFALSCDVLVAKRNMLFSLLKMGLEHFPVHITIVAQAFRSQA
jgi:hypothetical protein